MFTKTSLRVQRKEIQKEKIKTYGEEKKGKK